MVLNVIVSFAFITIFSQNIFSMISEDPTTIIASKKRSHIASIQPLDNFVQKVYLALEKRAFGSIIDAYYEFNEIKSESDWQEEIVTYPAIQWDFQSLKNAVGSQLFFDAAINQPHQNLLRNSLRPLLAFASGEERLADSIGQAKSNVSTIIANHPYFRNRFTLYALAAAYHLGHPLAHLVLGEDLRYLYYEEHKKEEGEDEDRFFSQSDQLLKIKLKNSHQQLRQFISVDRIEAFTDLSVESLSEVSQLEQKALLGLTHYAVLKEITINPRLSVYCYDEETLKHVIDHFIEIGNQGDFDGYYNTAILIKRSIDNKKIYKTDEEVKKGYALYDHYILLSYMYGFPVVSGRIPEEKVTRLKKEFGIYSSIFTELKKFIVPKRNKK